MKRPSSCLYIGNIHNSIAKEKLKKICESIAPVKDFRMVVKKKQDVTRSFAFCEFFSQDDANKAISKLQGLDLNGRKLKVNYADNPVNKGKKKYSQNQQKIDNVMPQANIHNNVAMVSPYMSPHFVQNPQMMSQINQPLPQVQGNSVPVYQILNNLPKQTIIDTLIHLKNMMGKDVNTAKAGLINNPNTAITILYLLHLSGVKVRTKKEIEEVDQSIKALAQLSPEQIARLPPDLQRKILNLRQRYKM